jgi:hypothetical protein
MNIKYFLLVSLFSLILLSSCSSVKVLNAWKSNDAEEFISKKALVIVRTDNNQARVAFEDAIAMKLRDRGMEATESYKYIPSLDPNKKLSEKEVNEAKKMIQRKGYNAVVLSVVKEKNLNLIHERDGGYWAGATYAGYYPMYYSGFYGYYTHPASYMNYGGVYVPETFSEDYSVTYILETLAFDLEAPEDKQLVAVVTSSVENPESAHQTARDYANKISNSFKKY